MVGLDALSSWDTPYFVGAVSVLVQSGLIAALLVQRRRRRAAEQAVRSLAGRLITAQEAERTRIARDLHDDACQEVAGIAVEISNLMHRRDSSQPTGPALASIHARTAVVAETLRDLSHTLHPSLLQHLGLVTALEAHCAEVERHYDVQVRFEAAGEVEPRDPTVALSLFRIAQEALRNAARHGHARHATVTLSRQDRAVTLTIADDGQGFDLARARRSGGLGLVSIEERARLVEGRVVIRSGHACGTSVTVRVPVGRARVREVDTPDGHLHVTAIGHALNPGH